jgi:hypothetical protein
MDGVLARDESVGPGPADDSRVVTAFSLGLGK